MKYCPKCGTQNPVESKFCKGCGFNFMTVTEEVKKESVNIEKQLPEQNSPKKKIKKLKISKKVWIISGAVALALVVLLFAFIFRENILNLFTKPTAKPEIELAEFKENNHDKVQKSQSPEVKPESLKESKDNSLPEIKEVAKSKIEPMPIPNNIKKQQSAKLPELHTVKEYFDYLSNKKIPYEDKTEARNEFIRNYFSSKNFKVNIKGENGYNTGQITIDDLTQELQLSNTPVQIITIKRPLGAGQIITELTISYK